MPDIHDAIEENALGPAEAQTDAGRMKQHSLRDQIAADKHLRDQEAAKKAHRGMSFIKLIPPGTV